jgi:hypothetical protein
MPWRKSGYSQSFSGLRDCLNDVLEMKYPSAISTKMVQDSIAMRKLQIQQRTGTELEKLNKKLKKNQNKFFCSFIGQFLFYISSARLNSEYFFKKSNLHEKIYKVEKCQKNEHVRDFLYKKIANFFN